MSISDKRFAFEMFEWAIEAAESVRADHWEARSRIEDLKNNCYSEYAEPGYTTPETNMIVLGNWNEVTSYNNEYRVRVVIDRTICQLARIFEALGIEMEWRDEWTSCHDCSKIVRTSPDGWGWTPSYFATDGHLTCIECIREDPEDYLSQLEELGRGNLIQFIDPGEHGYTLIQDNFESGLHPGQSDSPDKILEALNKAGCERVVMNIDSKGQFDVRFSAWMHDEEAEEKLALAKKTLKEKGL